MVQVTIDDILLAYYRKKGTDSKDVQDIGLDWFVGDKEGGTLLMIWIIHMKLPVEIRNQY